ncbi:hypothetical protein Tco_0820656 [Tanacetum coccineum]|uniref:Retrovirus-related Pol polyprotein from transposon TNT 1-94 n=1 Tax=Tanacetum coccineum TaxID=301880 RepID=A0ABQ5AD73_9ASTR
MKILSVVSVKVDKQFGYGYLEEIVVRRTDQKLYTFKEGNFQRLHLNDIEDIVLLHVQNKLFNLEGDQIVDLIDFQDSLDDEEDTRSSHEYLNDLEEQYQARALLAKSKRPTKDFKAKYNKVKAKLALLSSSASASKAATIKNKCLIAKAYEWDEEEVSLDDNQMVEIKVLMALAEENDAISKEGARNGEWVKISMRKCDIRKPIWYLGSRCSRHITGVKSYLYKYVEQPGPKFDEKRGTIFNSNKEVVMIAPRVRDVYVLDMTSSTQESCFFAKASDNLNWL